MEKIARFILKSRWIIAIVFLALIVYSICCLGLVNVEESIIEYLPDDTDTKKALEIMEKEFVTYGTANIMLKDIDYDEAKSVADKIAGTEGVKSVEFDDSELHYKDRYAVISVTFLYGAEDERAIKAYDTVVESLKDYDMCVPVPLYVSYSDIINKDMDLIIGLAALVIFFVLLFTSKSYAEILVFPIVFGVAALLNMGTNYWFGKISFVSNSVAIILQLALAIDYSIILCHRFTAEKERTANAHEAMVAALSKAIPEILSSCLTTISGLLALVAMQLKLGQDLGLVLAKSILFSILTVILLMPTLLLIVSKLMDKTKHKSFVPKINFWGKGVIKTRKVLPVVFLCLVVVFGVLNTKINYCYSLDNIDSNRPTETQIAKEEYTAVFGDNNMFVVLVPNDGYKTERKVVDVLKTHKEISNIIAISDIKVGDVYATDKAGYKEFSEMTGIDNVLTMFLYSAYAHEYNISTPITELKVPFVDMGLFAVDYIERMNIKLPPDKEEMFNEMKGLLNEADEQLIGDNYTRVVCTMKLPLEGDATNSFIETLNSELKSIDGDMIFAGEAVNSYDLKMSFKTDNIIISCLTGAFVFIILMLTFKSWGLPIILVAIIQGAIFINFGIVALTGNGFFFFVSLIVTAIQMGATIDYAILITNHYREERIKHKDDKNTALIEAINNSFPTIITSGTIMSAAAFLVGFIIKEPLISSLGICLGIGTIISIICVLTVLPQLLYNFEGILKKTDFPKINLLKKLKRRDNADNVSNESADETKEEVIESVSQDVDNVIENTGEETNSDNTTENV